MEILPCPFCGSHDIDYNENAQIIICGICNNNHNKGMSMIEKWNTRHSPWISVKDRLPENNEWILAFNGKDNCVCWIDIGNNDYLFMYGMGSQCQFRNVTHWMPLPSPPKESE